MYNPNTKINKNSAAFKKNKQDMQQKVAALRDILQTIYQGGNETSRARHQAQGKLLVRERIARLMDADQPFLELSPLAGYQLYEEKVPAGSLVTGIISIHGQDCMVIANDATVKGGCYFPITVKKHLRAQSIALEHALPCIYLVDSGGAYLPKQADLFADRNHFGRIFYNQAQLSARHIPQIAVVMGHCTAGGAYIPAMADESIIVNQQGTIFLAGPPLVKAATGEVVDAQVLGGARMHCEISGVADHCAHNEEQALQKVRSIMYHRNKAQRNHSGQGVSIREPKPPACDPSDLYGLIPSELQRAYDDDVREIIWRLVDDSLLDEFKPQYGANLVCGFAYIQGYPIGMLANNGVLMSESALKACHFIQLCCHRRIPLLFLQNIMGFMVGKRYEQQGITKHGAKMVQAVACADVPKLTVLIGGSFGAGNYAMCGRAYSPRFLWSWPHSNISIMGAQQAGHVLNQIHQKKKLSQSEQVRGDAMVKRMVDQYQKQSHAYYGSARLWDDGIIDPLDTRRVLARALRLAYHQQNSWELPDVKWPIWRM